MATRDAVSEGVGDAFSPTSAPGDTIRISSEQLVGALPTLSVDLHAALEGAGAPGADLEVLGLLGEGGMGRVLLARQRSLSRDVAVKTSLPGAAPATVRAILAEGAIAGSLEHPAIVPVHALGLDAGGLPVLVMKRVEGVSWEGLLADAEHPGWEGWEGTPADRLPGHLQILSAVCHALHFAHSRGFVHLDVKPQNVLIGRFGDAYLADWGVAARVGTRLTGLCGTPAFVAPEMVTGGVVDPRTDVFLLGAVLHFVLTGRPRNDAPSVTEALELARAARPHAYGAGVPEELAALANQACHGDPAERPPTAAAFREALARYLRHREARALADEAIARLRESEALLVQEEPSAEERARGDRLLAEARFGLEQALVQHPGAVRAREALARVEALERERRRRIEALEQAVRERDPARGLRWRWLGAALITGISASTIVALLLVGAEHVSPGLLLWVTVLATALIAVAGLIWRRHFLVNRFDHEVFGGILMGMAVLVLGRVIGLVQDMPPAAQIPRDALIQAGVMGICALAYLRWLWAVFGMFGLTALGSTAWPELGLLLFSVATTLSFGLASVVAALEARAVSRGRA
jgi:serine/threonine-protein kinase